MPYVVSTAPGDDRDVDRRAPCHALTCQARAYLRQRAMPTMRASRAHDTAASIIAGDTITMACLTMRWPRHIRRPLLDKFDMSLLPPISATMLTTTSAEWLINALRHFSGDDVRALPILNAMPIARARATTARFCVDTYFRR